MAGKTKKPDWLKWPKRVPTKRQKAKYAAQARRIAKLIKENKIQL